VNSKGLVAAIVIIIIIVIAGVYLAAINPGPSDNTPNVSNITPQNVSEQNNTTVTNETNSTNSTNNTNNNNTTVSAQMAQKIAQVYINSSAKAGNATLTTWSDGRLVWNVPILNSNGQDEGISIYIDAETGARLR